MSNLIRYPNQSVKQQRQVRLAIQTGTPTWMDPNWVFLAEIGGWVRPWDAERLLEYLDNGAEISQASRGGVYG